MISLPTRSTYPIAINHTMLSTLSTFTNALCAPQIVQRSSNSVGWIVVDFATGCVTVEFTNGYCYDYTNVSRRAIINLLSNDNISLGFWVNNNCVNNKRVNATQRWHHPNIAGVIYS